VASPVPSPWLAPELGLPLVFVAAAHLFDYVSFMLMVWRHGIVAEANPLVSHVAGEFGIPGVTLAKVYVVVATLAAAAIVRPKHPRIAASVLILSIAGGLVGGFTNIAMF
jgi:hypothetical protein